MACDVNGGCKICPGMWIAAAILAIMALQSLFWNSKDSTKSVAVDSGSEVEQASAELPAKDELRANE
jgi:hypothetical protein